MLYQLRYINIDTNREIRVDSG